MKFATQTHLFPATRPNRHQDQLLNSVLKWNNQKGSNPWHNSKVAPWWLVGNEFESRNTLFEYKRGRLYTM